MLIVEGIGIIMETIDKVTPMVEGKTYNRTFAYDAENDIVWMSQGTQLGKGDNARNVHFRYGMDMSNITLEDEKINCAKNKHITVMRPRLFKTLDEKTIAKLPLVIDPEDYPATGGAGITTKERNIRFMVDTMGLDRELAEHYADNPDELKAIASKTILRKKE